MSHAIGTKVKYHSIMAGVILGEVTGHGRDQLGDFIEWKVTSRKNMFYPHGMIDHVSADSPWLKLR